MECCVRQSSVNSERRGSPVSVYRRFQLRVLRLGFFLDGDVGVGVLPEREEVLICSLCFCCVALQGVGATKLQKRESANGFVQYDSAMVENVLEISTHAAIEPGAYRRKLTADRFNAAGSETGSPETPGSRRRTCGDPVRATYRLAESIGSRQVPPRWRYLSRMPANPKA